MGEEDTELEARAALLDFYSNRAVAHASYFIASIFGIVALLAICQNVGRIPFQENTVVDWLAVVSWFVIYGIFSIMGAWTSYQFSSYAGYADNLRSHAFKDKANLGRMKLTLAEKDIREDWEPFLKNEMNILKNEMKRDPAKIPEDSKEIGKMEEALKNMHLEKTLSFEYYDRYWEKKQSKAPIKRFSKHASFIYLMMILLLAFLAFYQIVLRAK